MSSQNTRDRKSLFASASILAAAAAAVTAAPTPAMAQDEEEAIVVTGTRIARRDYAAESPITTVTGEELVSTADVTLEQYINTLPQVVPAGTTTTNNPPNNGQANIDLRGLGANRNLVLIDGRRPMVSSNALTVDVNTIPAALIGSVEVISGGAGAVYGADAIAGVVNIRLRDDFEGVDLRTSYQNSTEFWDAEEFSAQAVIGGNFADDRGNIVFGFDHTTREAMLKGQRDFSAIATSTTGTPPDGTIRFGAPGADGSNFFSQAALDALFATAPYGSNPAGSAGAVAGASGKIGFNADGTLFAVGTFNSPLDMINYRGPTAFPNPRFAPDFYSYNFDPINLLQLPLDRNSFMTRANYRVGAETEVFAQAGWTEYTSDTALAPSPTPGVRFRNPLDITATNQVATTLVNGASTCGTANNSICSPGTQFVVPVTNPFIPADLAILLASRTGDDERLVGSGATEPFLFGFRSIQTGNRQQTFVNTVVSGLIGVRGPIGDSGWDWEAYVSEGRTRVTTIQNGNVQTQIVQNMLEGPVAGCTTPNFFGPGLVSQDCVDLYSVQTRTQLDMNQRVAQAYVTGPFGALPGGEISWVVGGEYRAFEYELDPGVNAGPISGFGFGSPEAGSNEFLDGFFEVALPLTENIEVSLGGRLSSSQFNDQINAVSSPREVSNSYKAAVTWEVTENLLFRASLQRAVRAPNFGELFAAGSTFPQIFNPCSTDSDARNGPNAVDVGNLCAAIGTTDPAFVENPGPQMGLTFTGNTNLKPETADTYTVGATFDSPWTGPFSSLRGSVDYYSIEVTDAIVAPDVNVAIAECFNYFGTNPTYDINHGYCAGLPGGSWANQGMIDPNSADPDGRFPGANEGHIQTSGIDVQLDATLEAGGMGDFAFGVVLSRLLEYSLHETRLAPTIDYVGSINYFGGGISLGQTLPEWRATTNADWTIGDFGFGLRGRYIGSMVNRMSLQYPGETSFTGVGSQWYWDVSGEYNLNDNLSLRLGVNNVTDEPPQLYAPNVQSGTDPSTYDIIGRRVFVALQARY